jgi:hypothetical protein
MTYTFEQLKEDVRKEAEALRAHATKEERERLDFSKLDPYNHSWCIYGMATGSCINQRAAYLVDKCAIRYFEDWANDVEELNEQVTDKPNNSIELRISESEHYPYSAIEAYIALPNAKNANLIAYLRGETVNLEL